MCLLIHRYALEGGVLSFALLPCRPCLAARSGGACVCVEERSHPDDMLYILLQRMARSSACACTPNTPAAHATPT